jgi:hypothetical protein
LKSQQENDGIVAVFLFGDKNEFSENAFEVTLSGLEGKESLPLPAHFRCCRYAVLQCCGLKDEFALMDNRVPQKSGNSGQFFLQQHYRVFRWASLLISMVIQGAFMRRNREVN